MKELLAIEQGDFDCFVVVVVVVPTVSKSTYRKRYRALYCYIFHLIVRYSTYRGEKSNFLI